MAKDDSVDTIDMFEDLEPYADIIIDKWYLVSSQGVESGPYLSYREAKNNCTEHYLMPMYGEQIMDMEDEETDWLEDFEDKNPTLGGW